jgi:hypothetical protein
MRRAAASILEAHRNLAGVVRRRAAANGDLPRVRPQTVISGRCAKRRVFGLVDSIEGEAPLADVQIRSPRRAGAGRIQPVNRKTTEPEL